MKLKHITGLLSDLEIPNFALNDFVSVDIEADKLWFLTWVFCETNLEQGCLSKSFSTHFFFEIKMWALLEAMEQQ